MSPVTLTPPTTIDNCAGIVTGTTTNSLVITKGGTVYWTFSDGNGNTVTAGQKVVVGSFVFKGFKSPINGAGGSCALPRRTITRGSNIPVKFEVECGDSSVVTGTPTLSIEKSDAKCSTLTAVGGGSFTLVGNEWHFNWDTSGLAKATYKLTATVQNGSKRTVWIRLK